MKPTGNFWISVIVGSALGLAAGCSKKQQPIYSSLKDADTTAQLKRFVAEKQAQVNAATNEPSPAFTAFFGAAETGDWLAISNAFGNLLTVAREHEHSGATDERRSGPRWEAAMEIWGIFDAFGEGAEKYSAAYGRDIIASIPPGSIYFGGTDPGRFIVTGMCRSQVNGDPFFVLTQNGLADGTYLDYLRQMYGGKIYIPSASDSERCFDEYTADLKQRAESHHLKPGEEFHPDANGKAKITGHIGVMEINGLIAKTIFDKNPTQDFFIEESFPLDWMYPQLEPHGLIFKINRQPAVILSDEIVQADHDYWAKYVQPIIGGWLTDDTSVSEVAAFAEKVYGRQDFSGFTGDQQFIRNAYAHKMFSKLRSAIAGLYSWRVDHAAGAADKERMAREADFAFRQAWALCPDSLEAVFRYVSFLMNQKRTADALLVAQTTANLPSMKGKDGGQLPALVEQLKKHQGPN